MEAEVANPSATAIKALSAVKYGFAWVLLQTPNLGFYLSTTQSVGKGDALSHQSLEHIASQSSGKLAAAVVWMAFSAFAVKVWQEVERDAVTHARGIVKRMPSAAKEVLARFWEWLCARVDFWSFERIYRRRIYEDYGLFNDRGLGLINSNRLDLEQVYVDLRIKSDPRLQTPLVDLLGRNLEGRESIWTFLRAMKPGCALALVGAPGCGKTTVLQHLMLVFARHRQGRFRLRQRLPVFLELRTLKISPQHGAAKSLSSIIRSYWKQHSRVRDIVGREPKNWLERKLTSGKVLVLLDGFDEVPGERRTDVSSWVDEQVRNEDHRNCLFVLTSRPRGYVEAPLEQAQILEIQPFSSRQSDQFITRWYLANEFVASGRLLSTKVRRRANEEATELRQRLAQNPYIQDLTVNPLLITMICMVHRYHRALPKSRSQLYAEICQVLLERWRQSRDIPDDLRGEQKLSVLRPLAAAFMNAEAREFSEAACAAVIKVPLTLVGRSGVGCEVAFLQEIQETSGLMLERERGHWAFAHKTFQEYLTAEYWLTDTAFTCDWKKKVQNDWWRETLLLYSARTDASSIVKAALEAGPPVGWALAYELLSESQSLTPDVRRETEAKLRHALHSTDPASFDSAAKTVLHLRMKQFLPASESLAYRTSLVTQAEYQLFIDSQSREFRFAVTPLHWISARFPGNPEAPLLGITFRQAQLFTLWLRESGLGASWRLPRLDEFALLQLPVPAVVWCYEGETTPAPQALVSSWADWTRRVNPELMHDIYLVGSRLRMEQALILALAFAIGEKETETSAESFGCLDSTDGKIDFLRGRRLADQLALKQVFQAAFTRVLELNGPNGAEVFGSVRLLAVARILASVVTRVEPDAGSVRTPIVSRLIKGTHDKSIGNADADHCKITMNLRHMIAGVVEQDKESVNMILTLFDIAKTSDQVDGYSNIRKLLGSVLSMVKTTDVSEDARRMCRHCEVFFSVLELLRAGDLTPWEGILLCRDADSQSFRGG